MAKRLGFTAHPEFFGETLEQATRRADRAAAKLHRAGVGAKVRLTRHARDRHLTLHKRAHESGVIVGFGEHRWTVKVRPRDYRKAGAFHVRFWEPVPAKA
jgi:hypothetical protein